MTITIRGRILVVGALLAFALGAESAKTNELDAGVISLGERTQIFCERSRWRLVVRLGVSDEYPDQIGWVSISSPRIDPSENWASFVHRIRSFALDVSDNRIEMEWEYLGDGNYDEPKMDVNMPLSACHVLYQR